MEKDIKDYREKELKYFLLGNILLIFVGTGLIYSITQPLGEDNTWKAVSALFSSSVLSAIIYVFSFVFDSIIPGRIKEKIVWLFTGLPGSRIFEDIKRKNKDERFTTQTATKAYADIYDLIGKEKDKKARAKIQNECWYKIYQNYEQQAQVYVSHRDSLLCRDMTAMMLWIIAAFIVLCLYLGISLPCKLALTLIAEFFVLWIAARVKGARFAYNVIAKDLAVFKEGKPNIIVE